jgi:hypothetical protein
VLKGCATPGFEVAAGAPEAERGVAVVEVSAVMGVEAREGVVVKARERVGVRRERRVRQRLQIMVVGVCISVAADWLSVAMSMALGSYGSSRCSKSQSGRALGGDVRRSCLST